MERMSEKGFVGIIVTIVVIAIIIFVITAICIEIKEENDYGIKQGIIIDKDYRSPYTSITYSGKITIPVHHPASYRIRIEKEIDGKMKSIWISVDETTYHDVNIGDYYNE